MIAPVRWPRAAITLLRTFGVRGAALRALHEARRAAGAFRPAPRDPAAHGGTPLFASRAPVPELARAGAVERGERVLAGAYEAFGWEWLPFPRDPTQWRRHPGTGREFPLALWWRVPHLDPSLGDIKQIWEPARFGWAYDLVRAWSATGDRRFPAEFHRRVGEWVASSPPFRGPHWACGQETAIRAIALLHAEANLPAAGGESARLVEILGWSGERIADAIGYAESQRNNHALSEAAGLVALGVRLAGMHPEAAHWLARGRRVLERSIRDQFDPDGWYIQHSFNYLRLALEQCAVAQAALGSRGASLSPGACARVAAGTALLTAVTGPDGAVPNHGSNDGANVVPRSSAPFSDFRPTLTAASIVFGIPMPADIVPDAETIAWFGGSPAPAAARPDGIVRGQGWGVARAGGTHVFLRAGSYRSRPGHLDPLQLDVRFDGCPVVVDAGTFLYNGPSPWRNGLASAAVHNGPLADGREPGIRGPRFLWYAWPSAFLKEAAWDGVRARFVATRPGGIEREVIVTAGEVRVRDRVRAESSAQVRWLLHPGADAGQVQVAGAVTADAREGAVAGWYSGHYAERVASRYIDAVRTGPGVHLIDSVIRRRGHPLPQPASR